MTRKDFSNIWYLYRDVAKYEKATLIVTTFSAVLSAIESFVGMIMLGKLVDLVLEQASIKELFGFVLFCLTLKAALRICKDKFTEIYNQKLENPHAFASHPYNEKAMTMDYEYLEDAKVQELRFRSFHKSYYGVAGWLLVCYHEMLQAVMYMLAAIVVVAPLFLQVDKNHGFWGSGWAAAVLLLFILVTSLVTYRCGVFFTKESNRIFNLYDAPYNKKQYYMDLFSRHERQKDIRLNQYNELLMADVERLFSDIKENENRQGKIMLKREFTAQSGAGIYLVLIYLFTAMKACIGLVSVGNVVTYVSSLSIFTYGIMQFTGFMGQSVSGLVMYANDYVDFMTLEKTKYPGKIPMEKRRDHKFQVDFEHVSFKYPGSDHYVIKDLSLSFVIGEKMAIVGKNGSGKTTFVKLLCRLYDVTEGCIKVNGIDIRKYDYREYCGLFSVVFQDFVIFSLPLDENIAASGEVDQEMVYDALCRAGMEERISRLDSLDVAVGKDVIDTGVNFSGGEKQKMAIARAIYKNAPIVIMDEPTAALDPVSECEVFEGFDKMVGKKTAVYISHRLASCRFCEDILVFDKGQVVQRGSHRELENQEGLYRQLWNAQAKYYVEE